MVLMYSIRPVPTGLALHGREQDVKSFREDGRQSFCLFGKNRIRPAVRSNGFGLSGAVWSREQRV